VELYLHSSLLQHGTFRRGSKRTGREKRDYDVVELLNTGARVTGDRLYLCGPL
jgi:hypothetical protein